MGRRGSDIADGGEEDAAAHHGQCGTTRSSSRITGEADA